MSRKVDVRLNDEQEAALGRLALAMGEPNLGPCMRRAAMAVERLLPVIARARHRTQVQHAVQTMLDELGIPSPSRTRRR